MKWLSNSADPGGWKSYDFTLVQGDDGQPLMVSDEIIRAYMGYVSDCRSNNTDELSFGDWMAELNQERSELAER
ncbi:MAG: hypothetical protein ACI81R_000142 [Bradymonadia bacterium]|jgi:hypothetical protein